MKQEGISLKLEERTPTVTITLVPTTSGAGLTDCTTCGRETYVTIAQDESSRCCRRCFRRDRQQSMQARKTFVR
jgi:hypothetical protein